MGTTYEQAAADAETIKKIAAFEHSASALLQLEHIPTRLFFFGGGTSAQPIPLNESNTFKVKAICAELLKAQANELRADLLSRGIGE